MTIIIKSESCKSGNHETAYLHVCAQDCFDDECECDCHFVAQRRVISSGET